MGSFKKALSDADVTKINAKNFGLWLNKNRTRIKAGVNKSIFYAGGEYDIDLKKFEKELRTTNTKIWETIKKLQSVKAGDLPFEYQTLEDVLKKTRSHPVLVDRNEVEKTFAHMYEYMDCLKEFPKWFPKKTVDGFWSDLSKAYAENAKGELKILDGVDENYRMLGSKRVLLETELLALLKNKGLSEEARTVLNSKVGKYCKYLEVEVKKTVKNILNSRKNLS